MHYISAYYHQNGCTPTVSEMESHFAQSASKIFRTLSQLEKKGYIQRYPCISRGIRILKEPSDEPPLLTMAKLKEELREQSRLLLSEKDCSETVAQRLLAIVSRLPA